MAASNDKRQRATPSAFSRLLKRLRTAADLTQEELAERAGVSARLISDLERGTIQRPRRDTVQMLADGLRLTGTERDTFVALARRRPQIQTEVAADAPSPRGNLPLPPTGLVGRERELTATTSLLMQPEVRLLTMTGPGGVGKTRLAIEAAARVAGAFPDGVVFVDLSAVTDPSLLGPTIARTVGLRYQDAAALIEQVVATLQELQSLVVLDNVEQLVPAAADVALLLERCPGLTILATSRQPLHLRAEREYPVAPLTLPDLSDLPPLNELSRVPSIDLFVRRTEAIRPSFALTADNAEAMAKLAVRLDGLPLAIELAATRLRMLSSAELLDRLERRLPMLVGGAQDLPARQRTLRATIDWSHELLSARERRLFRRLAVFAGGFTLDAAEHVGDLTEPDVFESLSVLIDHSLFRALDPPNAAPSSAPSRYGMFETIREFALESLEASGEQGEMRARHAAWCVELAELAALELNGPDQARWFARLGAEHDNLRAALSWTIEQRDSDSALRLCGAIARLWYTEGYFTEGRRWMEQAFALDDQAVSPAMARALLGAGVIAHLTGDYAGSEVYTERALLLYRALDDPTGVASAFGNLGVLADAQGDYQLAVERYEQALTLFRTLNDDVHTNFMLGNLGLIAYLQGDYARAESFLDEALLLGRTRGDQNSSAITLGNLGLVAFALGDYARATTLQQEALRLRKTLSNRSHLARSLENFAHLAVELREPERAARLFGAAAALRAEIGAQLPPNDRDFNERFMRDARDQLGPVAFQSAWEDGASLSVDEAIAYALLELDDASLPAEPRIHADY